MAPKRKAEKAAEPAAKSGRVTRSATRLTRSGAKSSSVANFIELPNSTRKSPVKPKKAEVKGKGKGKVKEEGEGSGAVKEETAQTVVVIEHCTQCKSFKTRASQVKEALESSESDVVVKLNPDKPRRGCFEIRLEDGDKTFISLLDMKRPFKPMKDLDMGKVISDIIDDLSNAS
ncbi:unnamed protein product [Lathyrus oleraceus]|uniref:Selenoprotein H n=1 Tax=Pisum sativum TaxID=3888 RepID=A0A9D5A3E4_PEA|nr:uncharacterized protein LOC127095941 [Pisum sativum]KAI5393954.1 hypothetical protein KIW84_060881 [Pisum sativum]